MSVRVHLAHAADEESVALLRERLGAAATVTTGDDLGADVDVLVAGVPTREQLEASPHLRALVIPWAGLSTRTRELLADFPELDVRNLHHNAVSTAETAVALLLAAAKSVVPLDVALRRGDWSDRGRAHPSTVLHGRTALVLGFGAVGRHVARILQGFGMHVIATRRRLDAPATDAGVDVQPAAALDGLLPRAHAVVIALPLTPETDGLLGEAELGRLPPGAVLVNVGRGPIVDEGALHDALASGRLGAAGIDVWYSYPKTDAERAGTAPSARPFHELDNVVMSPHRAGGFEGNETARMEALAALLLAMAQGDERTHRVDVARGY